MGRQFLRGHFLRLVVAVLGGAAPGGSWQLEILKALELDAGFHLLYELSTAEAVWQTAHPDDPLVSA